MEPDCPSEASTTVEPDCPSEANTTALLECLSEAKTYKEPDCTAEVHTTNHCVGTGNISGREFSIHSTTKLIISDTLNLLVGHADCNVDGVNDSINAILAILFQIDVKCNETTLSGIYFYHFMY